MTAHQVYPPRYSTKWNWDRSADGVGKLSVQVRCGAVLEQGFEICENHPEEAIAKVIEHARYMTQLGGWPAGLYVFTVMGTTRHRQEVQLTGPRRA